jgi:hypothetical protein
VVIESKPLALSKFGKRAIEVALQCIGNHHVTNRSTCRAHQVMMMTGEVFSKFI